jgi:hypothetical protein
MEYKDVFSRISRQSLRPKPTIVVSTIHLFGRNQSLPAAPGPCAAGFGEYCRPAVSRFGDVRAVLGEFDVLKPSR